MFLKILKIRFELMQLLNQHFIYYIQKVCMQFKPITSSFDISKQDA